ncbi:FHA domain-containing protein [Nocardioides sp. GCM10027113]|uniref:FHA domain-containing protein n=1 Tax=unclassified Nocardioides TaxID=2615069 RepID=UPI00361F1622
MSVPLSYRPGRWYAVLGDRVTLLLPPSARARAARVWEAVDDGADAEAVLDLLLADGLRGLPGFVLLAEGDADLLVLVRGDSRVAVGHGGSADPVEVTGAGAATWVEARVPAPTSLHVEPAPDAGPEDGPDDGADEGPTHPVTGGLLRVGRLAGRVADDLGSDSAAAEPTPDAGPATEAWQVPASLAAPAAPQQPADERDVMATADTADQPAVPAAPDLDHDGLTRAGPWDPAPFAPPPGIPGQPPAPGVTGPVARLVMSHGETVDVDRPVVVGRAPEARRFPSDEQPRLVTVPSPQQEISSTHLEIRPGSGADHGSAVVTDLGSTNGTVLVQPGMAPEDLRPGVAVQLLPGAVVDLGDGLTIRVADA